MIAKKSQKFAFIRKNWAYFLIAILVVAVAFFGSRDKSEYSESSMNMQSIMSSSAQVSADKVSQFYMVAELADSMKLASAGLAETNYSTVVLLHENGQITDDTGKLSKPVTVNTASISRGVVQYLVREGETLESIARGYGVTTDQIRWSNGMSTNDITPGQVVMVPTVSGIAYRVKNGDNVEALATKYGSSVEEIITVNDLERNRDLAVDSIILIPSGVLPETERPEYVVRRTTPSRSQSVASSYQYNASYASGNRYAYGWCTWYAWQWRHDNMPPNYNLPSNMGNANTWASAAAAAGFSVDRKPQRGDVFQTSAGWAGHVGIVMAVNADGSITISDMNGVAGWGRVGTSVIPASAVGSYMYIHGR